MTREINGFWRRITISQALSLIIGGAIGIVALVIGGFGATTLRDEKLRDTWSNVYLQAEHSVSELSRLLTLSVFADSSRTLNSDLLRKQFPDLVLGQTAPGKMVWMHGTMPELGVEDILSMEEAEKDASRQTQKFTLWRFKGRTYLVRFLEAGMARPPELDIFGRGKAALLWQMRSDSFFNMFQSGLPRTTIAYVLNRSGQLIWSSSGNVQPNNVQSRALIVAFKKAASDRMQLDLRQGERDIHGVFHDIPDSNAMLFLEIPRNITMIPLKNFINKFVFISLFVFVLAIFCAQWPLARVTAPLRSLAQLSNLIAKGNYEITPEVVSFGEVRGLSRAFRGMTIALREKDASIKQFLQDEKERIRLQHEIQLTQRIQENLLAPSRVSLPNLNAHFSYLPAADVAGDWYGYATDEVNKRIITIVADVSGHGAGAAMFTAVIAGLFQDSIVSHAATFQTQSFLSRLHSVINALGKGQWHVTICVAEYYWEKHRVNICAAGCPPIATLNAGKVQWHFLKSNVLGLSEKIMLANVEIEMDPGSYLIVPTDGLYEAKDKLGKHYGRKRMNQKLTSENFSSVSAEFVSQSILSDWRDFCSGVETTDDVCLAVLHVES